MNWVVTELLQEFGITGEFVAPLRLYMNFIDRK